MEKKKPKAKTKPGQSRIITECTKCGKPAFMFGLCLQHSAEFEKDNDDMPTHNDWKFT